MALRRFAEALRKPFLPLPERVSGPRPRDRWLALALLVGVLALVVGAVFRWWVEPMRAADERIETLQQRELRLRGYLEQAPHIVKRLEVLQQRAARQPGFLPETTPQLATASLIQRLETVVVQASPGNRSCAITNRSPFPVQEEEQYLRVAVQVRLRCGTPELLRVLHALEGGSPRLFVGNLDIFAQRMSFNQDGSADPASTGLDVSFDLHGYLAPATAGGRADAL